MLWPSIRRWKFQRSRIGRFTASVWCLTMVCSATTRMLAASAAAGHASAVPRSCHNCAGCRSPSQSTPRGAWRTAALRRPPSRPGAPPSSRSCRACRRCRPRGKQRSRAAAGWVRRADRGEGVSRKSGTRVAVSKQAATVAASLPPCFGKVICYRVDSCLRWRDGRHRHFLLECSRTRQRQPQCIPLRCLTSRRDCSRGEPMREP